MTVKDLRDLLKKFPADATIVYALHSDVSHMDPKDIALVDAIERVSPAGGYYGWLTVLSEHDLKTSSAEDRARVRPCVLFPGN